MNIETDEIELAAQMEADQRIKAANAENCDQSEGTALWPMDGIQHCYRPDPVLAAQERAFALTVKVVECAATLPDGDAMERILQIVRDIHNLELSPK